jgi:hypothetical protein
MVLLSAAFLGYLWIMGAPVTMALVEALALTFVEMLVITAVAIFFSSASTPILSAIFTTIIFFFGQLTQEIVDMAGMLQSGAATEPARERAQWITALLYKVYLVLPNLHNFNIRQDAVHAAAGELPIDLSVLAARGLYGVSYAAALLLAAHLLFSRRNF